MTRCGAATSSEVPRKPGTWEICGRYQPLCVQRLGWCKLYRQRFDVGWLGACIALPAKSEIRDCQRSTTDGGLNGAVQVWSGSNQGATFSGFSFIWLAARKLASGEFKLTLTRNFWFVGFGPEDDQPKALPLSTLFRGTGSLPRHLYGSLVPVRHLIQEQGLQLFAFGREASRNSNADWSMGNSSSAGGHLIGTPLPPLCVMMCFAFGDYFLRGRVLNSYQG